MQTLWPVVLSLFVLTFFNDLLEITFARANRVLKTLRFWLYFLFHFLVSGIAAYALHWKITEWYLLSPVAAFLGVTVISNTNFKLAGFSVLPVAEQLSTLKSKMLQQAADDARDQIVQEVNRPFLAGKLSQLGSAILANKCSDCLNGKKRPWPNSKITASLNKLKQDATKAANDLAVTAAKLQRDSEFEKVYTQGLTGLLLREGYHYAEQKVDTWLADLAVASQPNRPPPPTTPAAAVGMHAPLSVSGIDAGQQEILLARRQLYQELAENYEKLLLRRGVVTGFEGLKRSSVERFRNGLNLRFDVFDHYVTDKEFGLFKIEEAGTIAAVYSRYEAVDRSKEKITGYDANRKAMEAIAEVDKYIRQNRFDLKILEQVSVPTLWNYINQLVQQKRESHERDIDPLP